MNLLQSDFAQLEQAVVRKFHCNMLQMGKIGLHMLFAVMIAI
jgi:hypothetical protein